MFYHLWTMKKPLEEVQQGTTFSMSLRHYTMWKIKPGNKYNYETGTSIPFHTATKPTSTVFTIS
jgi:hypothetical protein